MSHHASEMSPEEIRLMKEFCLGPTGNFPDGKLNENDEGEIKIAIGVENNRIVMNFGKPISYIGFTREEALDIINSLADKAFNLPITKKGS